MADIFTKQVYV